MKFLHNFEVRHPRCVGSKTKNFCVLHIQSNTTIVVFDCMCNTQKFFVMKFVHVLNLIGET